MSVATLARARFGGPTRPEPRDVQVQTSITEVMKSRPDRFAWTIVNNSANRGYIGFDREVTSTHGHPIEASGGYVSAAWEEDGEMVTYAVFGINEVAAGDWYVIEQVRF